MTVLATAQAAYILAALLFILALAGLSRHESARAGNVFAAIGSSITFTQSTRLRSQRWPAPARNRPTTWALVDPCVKSMRTSAVASSWNRPTRARPPAGAQVA